MTVQSLNARRLNELAADFAVDPAVLGDQQSTIDEQVNQAKVVVKAMAKAVKNHVPAFLFPGKYADPAPSLLAATAHIKPNNDAQERIFGMVDERVHNTPRERAETTDAHIKNKLIWPFDELNRMTDDERATLWTNAQHERSERRKVEKQRSAECAAAKMARVQNEEKKTEKSEAKRSKKKKAYNAVKVATTKGELDKLLRGTGETLGKKIIIEQIKQLRGVYDVSSRTLPLTRDNRPLPFAGLYDNLCALLRHGDPRKAATENERKKEKREQSRKRKRGRPQGSNVKRRKVSKDGEWTAESEEKENMA